MIIGEGSEFCEEVSFKKWKASRGFLWCGS